MGGEERYLESNGRGEKGGRGTGIFLEIDSPADRHTTLLPFELIAVTIPQHT
jgi:hypothetical protein